MRLKVLGNKDTDKTVYLQLSEDGDGDVRLQAVESNGDVVSSLLLFTTDGLFYRCPYVDQSLGFELDDDGRIQQEA
jgi:hypothetical protein